jgi:hypothetical protein
MQRTRKAAEKLPWDDVRLFLALFRSQTVGEAATALGIDASTVSRRLAAMEESLSATLFDRGRDGIAATKATASPPPRRRRISCRSPRRSSKPWRGSRARRRVSNAWFRVWSGSLARRTSPR